jgi:uncharacterized protein YcaQ
LFEYWAHAACFLPSEDYGLYRRAMLEQTQRSQAWLAVHPEETERVLAKMRTQSAVRSADFPRTDGKAGQWWDRKPEKIALECLFNTGAVMIARREQFQRVYALQAHVLPGWDDQKVPSAEAVQAALVEKTIRALGITPIRWIADYFRLPKRGIVSTVEQLRQEGKVFPVAVEGWQEPAYVHVAHRVTAERVADGTLGASYTTLLSPFDPVVWDRARAEALFRFTYRIETYTPLARRQYGYFTLPILHNGMLVGRVDPKAHRRQGIFEIKAIHLEPNVTVTTQLVTQLATALQACAAWHRTPQVVIRYADPPELAPQLQSMLDKLRERS